MKNKILFLIIGIFVGLIVGGVLYLDSEGIVNIIQEKTQKGITLQAGDLNDFSNIIELKDDDYTLCKTLREDYYSVYSLSQEAFSEKDKTFLYDYKQKLCDKYGIKCEEYLLDMLTCAFILKTDVKEGLLVEYRNEKTP